MKSKSKQDDGSTIKSSQNLGTSESTRSLSDTDEMFFNTNSKSFTHHLQNFIDNTSENMYGEWEVEIPMDMKCGNEVLPDYNILTYIGQKAFKKIPTLIPFCPDKYPVYPIQPEKLGRMAKMMVSKEMGLMHSSMTYTINVLISALKLSKMMTMLFKGLLHKGSNAPEVFNTKVMFRKGLMNNIGDLLFVMIRRIVEGKIV